MIYSYYFPNIYLNITCKFYINHFTKLMQYIHTIFEIRRKNKRILEEESDPIDTD